MTEKPRDISELIWNCLSGEEIGTLLRKAHYPTGGTKDAKIKRLLHDAKMHPSEIFHRANQTSLRFQCVEYGLPHEGTKEELVKRLLGLVDVGFDSSGTEVQEAIPSSPTSEVQALSHLDPTRENVLSVLTSARIKGRLRDEYDAQHQLFEVFAERFGDEVVGRERGVGGYSFTLIDIDINGEFAIEVKHAASLFTEISIKASEVQRLFGQLVLYSKQYKKENIFVAVCGTIEPTAKAPMNEIKKLVGEMGATFVHVPEE